MGIGQPCVERHQTDFGAVADQDEDEGEVQQFGVTRCICPIMSDHAMAGVPPPMTGWAAR